MTNMRLRLDKNDEGLVKKVVKVLDAAIKRAHLPQAVAKKIVVRAVYYRNKGRTVAMRRHPFQGICEVSNRPLKKEDAHLDELEPERGYAGKVRWVCPKANNSGSKSCGGC